MGRFAARFFAHLQGAAFYHAAHEQAVALLPEGAGRSWLDLGCGPGLVGRLAAARGYAAVGRDKDSDMVAMARHIARHDGVAVRFEVAALDDGPQVGQRFDVVSAASLLFVLKDRAEGLQQMLAALKPDGVLLVIESTAEMRLGAAWRWLRHAGYGKRGWMLLLWAWVRGGSAVSEEELRVAGWRGERVPLLGGLVAAWIIRGA